MKPDHGIAVDGWCKGNPGPGGYIGVCLKTNKILFKGQLGDCTNNIAEYIGVCHALGYAKKIDNTYNVIYTDSQTAISWVNNKSCKSNFDTGKYIDLAKKIWKCDMFLVSEKRLPMLKKWETKEWGEIPADPGHKK